jgi:hypothetical protein
VAASAAVALGGSGGALSRGAGGSGLSLEAEERLLQRLTTDLRRELEPRLFSSVHEQVGLCRLGWRLLWIVVVVDCGFLLGWRLLWIVVVVDCADCLLG